MKIYLLLMVCLIIFQISQATVEEKSSSVNDKEMKEMYIALEKDSIIKSMIIAKAGLRDHIWPERLRR